MKAKFNGGPYDRQVLQIPPHLDHVQLPVTVSTALPDHVQTREFHCQAMYQLIMKNSVELTYQFIRISAP